MSASIEGVYVVTDTQIQDRFNHVELAEFAVEGGAPMIQFREKRLSPAKMLKIISKMQSICDEGDCRLIVNDRVDLAMTAGADGVHLGQQDLPIDRVKALVDENTIIGGTASTPEEAVQVERQGADYVGFGHIFETRTKKKDYKPRGLDLLGEVTDTLDIPVMAIGGITAENAGQVLEAGAAGFAVTSAACAVDDPADAVRRLVRVYEQFT